MATKYPLPVFHFRVDWGGTNIGFSEVSGLNMETQVIEYRDGTSPDFSTIKMPGMQKYANLTLKRGVMAADNEFYKWWNTHQQQIPQCQQSVLCHPPVLCQTLCRP